MSDNEIEKRFTNCLEEGGVALDLDWITPKSWAELIDRVVRECPDVESISFDQCELGAHGMSAFVSAIERGLLQRLRDLNFSGAQLGDRELMALSRGIRCAPLLCLERLELSSTDVSDDGVKWLIETAMASRLDGLKQLGLCCNTVSDVGMIPLVQAASIGKLPSLTALDVSDTDVTDEFLSALATCIKSNPGVQLRSLNLDETQVTDAGLFALTQVARDGHLWTLTELGVAETQISDAGLLDLACMAHEGHFPSLRDLSVGSVWISVDKGVLDSGNAVEIFEWVMRSAGDHQVLHEAKLLVLGQGGVGKTSLCERIILPALPDRDSLLQTPSGVETHDIDIHHIDVPLSNCHPPLSLRVWDFGGQDHLHSTHRFFVGAERTLYLLVLDASRSPEANRLHYWLRFISHYGTLRSGEDGSIDRCEKPPVRAPVIVVLTKCDRIAQAQSGLLDQAMAKRILGDAEKLQQAIAVESISWQGVFVTAVIDGIGYPPDRTVVPERLRGIIEARHTRAAQELKNAIKEYAKHIVGLGFPVPRFAIEIRKWIAEQFELPQVNECITQFRYDQPPFTTFCEEHHIYGSGKAPEPNAQSGEARVCSALRLLKSLGMVHWIGDVGEVVLNPDSAILRRVFNPRWVKTPVYKLIRLPTIDFPGGWVEHEKLDRLLPLRRAASSTALPETDQEWFERLGLTADDRAHLIDLMVDSQVAVRISTPTRQGLLVPDCLGIFAGEWAPPSDSLVTFCECTFLPERALLKLVASYVEQAISSVEAIPKNVFRNFAALRWQHNGVTSDVWLQLRNNVREDRLSLAVRSSAQEHCWEVLLLFKHQIDVWLRKDGLRPRWDTMRGQPPWLSQRTRGAAAPRARTPLFRQWSGEEVASWFKGLKWSNLGERLHLFRWVAKIDEEAMKNRLAAMSYADLAKVLGTEKTGLKHYGQSYIRDTIAMLDEDTSKPPFPPDLWTGAEQGRCRVKKDPDRKRGGDERWTARAWAMQQLVDAAIKGWSERSDAGLDANVFVDSD